MTTQEKIITAALAQFYQWGFNASGVSLLAEKAGVTKKTLYAHFPSKDDLILATLQYRHAQFMNQLQGSLRTDGSAALIQSYWQFLQDWFDSPMFFGCFFINVSAEFSEPTHPFFLAAQAHKTAVRHYLNTCAQTAGVNNAADLAEDLFLLGEGLIVLAQTNRADIIRAKKSWQRLLSIYVVNGLLWQD